MFSPVITSLVQLTPTCIRTQLSEPYQKKNVRGALVFPILIEVMTGTRSVRLELKPVLGTPCNGSTLLIFL